MLQYMYTAFPINVCSEAIDHLNKTNSEELTIDKLFTFLSNPSEIGQAREFTSEELKNIASSEGITLDEMQEIIDEKPSKTSSATANAKLDNDELEAKLMKKRQK